MPGARPVAHQWTMTNTQGEPPAAHLLKLSHEFKSSSFRIDVGTSTTLLRRWELVMVLTEELGMHRVAAKFVPRILTGDQKQQRGNVCTELN